MLPGRRTIASTFFQVIPWMPAAAAVRAQLAAGTRRR
jgi:hypothetical protein